MHFIMAARLVWLLAGIGAAIRLDDPRSLVEQSREQHGGRRKAIETRCETTAVTDAQRCGTQIVEGIKDEVVCNVCRQSNRLCQNWCRPTCCPVCPSHCRTSVETPIECQVKTWCTYRLRATIDGHIRTVTFENSTVDLNLNSFEVVDADPAVKAILDGAVDQLAGAIQAINVVIDEVLQPAIETVKASTKAALIRELRKHEGKELITIFNQPIRIKTLLSNVTELVEGLLPPAGVETWLEGEQLSASVQVTDFGSHVSANLCSGLASVEVRWLWMLPFTALSLLMGWKYPRLAVGVFVFGIFFSLKVNRICRNITPNAEGAFTFDVAMPSDMRDAGSPSELTVAVNFTGNGSLVVSSSDMPLSAVEQFLEELVIGIGDAKGKLPVTIIGATVHVRPDGDRLWIEPTSGVDAIGRMDLTCAPECGIGAGEIAVSSAAESEDE